ncbi:hypothetical protein [Mesobacillus maritimus]|uniref:hypothetical protein n=1 Tax=Mesobacillus maritimus TaxID=1643336 RepID=UPI00384A84AB
MVVGPPKENNQLEEESCLDKEAAFNLAQNSKNNPYGVIWKVLRLIIIIIIKDVVKNISTSKTFVVIVRE